MIMVFRCRIFPCSCFFLACSAQQLSFALSWGPKFRESTNRRRFGFTLLHSIGNNPGEGEQESDFRPHSLRYENRVEETYGVEPFWTRLFISQPLLVDSEVFGVVNPFDRTPDEDDLLFGDDEDCAIPLEYKQIAKESDIGDIWEYLGLKRALPLK